MLPLEEVARSIKRRRRLIGVSQAKLARDAKTSQSLIAKLEQGRINPSYEAVRAILEALDRMTRDEEPSAQELMQAEPVFAEPDERMGVALDRMKTQGFSQLPILDNGRPVGSISESLILEHIERGESMEDLKNRRVHAVMRSSFPVVDPQTSRRLLVEMLRESPAILVMDAGRPIGVVTKSDLW